MEEKIIEQNNDFKEKKCYKVKVIIVGNAGVGKTNILYRLVNKEFMSQYQATIAVDFLVYTVEFAERIFKLVLMDTAGCEAFRSIRRGYYTNCSFAIIVYDITDQDSFNGVKDWINDCKNYANENIHMVLVGNKIDLGETRKISTEEGTELANEYNMDFFECSAKTGENIESIFSRWGR